MNTMKPGYQTTEFWSVVLASAFMAGASQLGITLDKTTVISITSMIMTYGIGRIYHKQGQNT